MLPVPRSARRPPHVTPPEHVAVCVEDRLSGPCTRVEHQPERIQPLVRRHRSGHPDQFDHDLGIGRGELRDVGMVTTRNDKHVGRRLRRDIAKRQRLCGLVHDLGRHIARDDAAEQAIWRCAHAPHRTGRHTASTVEPVNRRTAWRVDRYVDVACSVTIGAPARLGRVSVVGAYEGWAVDTGSDTGPFSAIGDADASASSEADRLVSELYAVHYAGLVRLAALLLRDHAVAEEAVQDAFVSLHRRWRRLRDTRNAAAYLRTSVVHNTRSIQRRRAVAAKHPDDVLLDAPSAESGAMRAASSRAVVEALQLLPRRQREALVLRYYADLSEAEIAETMKISRGAVKSHASRGMAALRANLEQWA